MKFSVIIPVYNVAPYLCACLDSVIVAVENLRHMEKKRGYLPVEMICVDDGSTDGSGTILDNYARTINNDYVTYKVIHQNNSGVAMARNAALDVVTGDWFFFLDSDDVWAPHILSTCTKMIEQTPDADLLMFMDQHFPDKGKPAWGTENYGITDTIIDLSKCYNPRILGFVAPKIGFRRELVGHLREKPYRVGEDLLFLAQSSKLAKKIVKTDVQLYGYRDRPASVTRSNVTENKAIDTVSYLSDIAEEMRSSILPLSKGATKWLANTLVEMFYFEQLSCLGDKEKARHIWSRALKCMFFNRKFQLFQRVRALLVSFCPYVPVTTVCCWLPSFFKRKWRN